MSQEHLPSWATELANSILLAVKSKDPFTFYHCCRVGRQARRLAKSMGLTKHEQNVLEYSGLFHDIGKIGIPDSILLKPDRLVQDELKIMKSHPIKSAEMIESLIHIPFFRFVLPGIRCHHERFDGSGYPFGLVAERIPLPARIIAVVDTVDAMTNSRPYRKALSLEHTLQELKDCSGSQFDPNIVNAYLDSKVYQQLGTIDGNEEVVVPAVLKKAA